MKFSRNQLNRAGDNLIGQDPFLRNEAIKIISEWRESYLPILRELNDNITNYLNSLNICYEFTSQRIKRMTSISEKLRNNIDKDMKLGGLQDIGGIRYVFADIKTLNEFDNKLQEHTFNGFEFKKRYDYVSYPKNSGYRSIHYVYKYNSDNKEYDGLQLELQIRTRLQHSWAMAVETASLISQTSLKANIEDNNVWRNFFKLVGAIFSKKEKQTVHSDFDRLSEEELCNMFFTYTQEHKLLEQLKVLRTTINQNIDTLKNGYCILIVDFSRRIVNIRVYSENEETQASQIFTEIENTITANEAALMVSIEKMQEIKKAYPSYFLDTNEFLNALEDFEDKCNVLIKRIKV